MALYFLIVVCALASASAEKLDIWSFIFGLRNAECGVPTIQPDVRSLYIVGGVEAIKNSWPWMAQMRYHGYHMCGGSVVGRRHILTAAHCVEGNMAKPSSWEIRLGVHYKDKTDSNTQSFRVSRIISHSRFNSKQISNDIAIMVVNKDIEFNKYVQPVCVALESYKVGEIAVSTGWGSTAGTGSNSVLRQVAVPMIDPRTCSSLLGKGFLHPLMNCAGYLAGGKDACQGDSGGPLVALTNGNWYITGITSWGYGCAEASKPGVYTNVANYHSWITSRIYM